MKYDLTRKTNAELRAALIANAAMARINPLDAPVLLEQTRAINAEILRRILAKVAA